MGVELGFAYSGCLRRVLQRKFGSHRK